MFAKRKHKDIDLLKAYQCKKTPSKYNKVAKLLLPPLLVVLVFVSVFAVNQFYIYDMKEQISVVDEEIKTYEDKISLVGSEDYQTLAKIQEQNSKIQTLIETLKTYPKLTSSLMNVFNNKLIGGMSIQTIMFEDGVISVSLQSQDVLNIEAYVRSIRESGNFTSVEYSGYQIQ